MLKNMLSLESKLYHWHRDAQIFQKSRHEKADKQQELYSGLTNIRHLYTKFSRPGNLAFGMCASVHYHLLEAVWISHGIILIH
jgi:hypothetical protein